MKPSKTKTGKTFLNYGGKKATGISGLHKKHQNRADAKLKKF